MVPDDLTMEEQAWQRTTRSITLRLTALKLNAMPVRNLDDSRQIRGSAGIQLSKVASHPSYGAPMMTYRTAFGFTGQGESADTGVG